jgi:hypothetical protein
MQRHQSIYLLGVLLGLSPKALWPNIHLVFPTTGSVVNAGTLVIAQLADDLSREQVDSINFQYSTDGVTYFTIDGVGSRGAAEVAAVWDTDALAPGEYVLRVQLIDIAQQVWTDIVSVHVNAQPVANAVVTPTGTLFQVHYDATSSFDPDGSIASYDWDFGDGTRGSGAVIDHQFPGAGAYGVALTVTDQQGGASTRHTIVAIGMQGFLKAKEKNTCGCIGMDVKDSGSIDQPNDPSANRLAYTADGIPGIPAADTTNLGAYNDGAAGTQLDTTKAQFQVRMRFEVIADLAALSNPKLCREGQRVQATWTSLKNGMIANTDIGGPGDPRKNSRFRSPAPNYNSAGDPGRQNAVCPYGGADWCDDDMHGGSKRDGSAGRLRIGGPPSTNKRYDGQQRILWIDAPGFSPLPANVLSALAADQTAQFKAKFEALVDGEGGCGCSWEVLIEVNKSGMVLNNGVRNKQCFVVD